MAIDFRSPSYRAASSDLTIAISPLGLVELADEEFEVHGPRLNRYAQNWAFYLGHHWGYLRELGEPQLTFNYVRAMADWMNSFTFGQGVSWRSPKETEAIIPPLLQKVWEQDNSRKALMWEIGQQGGVSGDCFVKVAYEEPWMDPAGNPHPGRTRILPLNSSFCFPEFHPHDRSRLIRFKLKYRFWGTALEGTRQVFTYTELMTDEAIEEYINDELIDSYENALGVIPIAMCANFPITSSPWGLADIQDIVGLNREYNEKATDISDIINYHASPTTVIIGAKASNLEKGARKVWGGLPKDAQVYNLELAEGLDGPMAYMAMLKTAMHEMTGIPESALGQIQPISNTSGVALAIQFQPAMNKFSIKSTQYGGLFERINELIIRTVALKEPWQLRYDPTLDPPLKEGQLEVLDPEDPTTYQTTAHFKPPMPIDALVKLNEIMTKMQLGLESKRGALRELGEEFVDEKMQELFNELHQDALEQGALDLLRAEIGSMIAALTGVTVGPDGVVGQAGAGNVASAGGPDVNQASGGGEQMTPQAGNAEGPMPGVGLTDMGDAGEILNEITTLAMGTKLSQRRKPNNDED